MNVSANPVEITLSSQSGKTTIDSETVNMLRKIAARLTLRTNQRMTYRETMTIIENGLDDETLDMFIQRYNAVNPDRKSRAS